MSVRLHFFSPDNLALKCYNWFDCFVKKIVFGRIHYISVMLLISVLISTIWLRLARG